MDMKKENQKQGNFYSPIFRKQKNTFIILIPQKFCAKKREPKNTEKWFQQLFVRFFWQLGGGVALIDLSPFLGNMFFKVVFV